MGEWGSGSRFRMGSNVWYIFSTSTTSSGFKPNRRAISCTSGVSLTIVFVISWK